MRLPRIVRRVRRVRRGSGAQRWEDVVDGDRDLDLDRVHIGQRADPGRYPVPEATGQGVQIDPESDASWGRLSGLLQASEAAEPVVDYGQGGCFGGPQAALQPALRDGP